MIPESPMVIGSVLRVLGQSPANRVKFAPWINLPAVGMAGGPGAN